MRNNLKDWAPICAVPHCINRVSYHKSWTKTDDTLGVRWKVCCEYHRTAGKSEADRWKLEKGCANKTRKHYNFECYTSQIVIPDQLDINHIDGNRSNNSPDNLELLCKNCHVLVTKQNEHHKIRYTNVVKLSSNLFEVIA